MQHLAQKGQLIDWENEEREEEVAADQRNNAWQKSPNGSFFVPASSRPTTNGGMQKRNIVNKISAGILYTTQCIHIFPRLALFVSRCIGAKFSASELSRKFIKSALLVGRAFSHIFQKKKKS